MNAVFWLFSAAAPALLLSFPTAQVLVSPSVSSFLCTKWGRQNAPGGSQNQHRSDHKHELQVDPSDLKGIEMVLNRQTRHQWKSKQCLCRVNHFPFGLPLYFPRWFPPPWLMSSSEGLPWSLPCPSAQRMGWHMWCGGCFLLGWVWRWAKWPVWTLFTAWAGKHQRGSLRSLGQWLAGPTGQVRKDCWQGGDLTGPSKQQRGWNPSVCRGHGKEGIDPRSVF